MALSSQSRDPFNANTSFSCITTLWWEIFKDLFAKKKTILQEEEHSRLKMNSMVIEERHQHFLGGGEVTRKSYSVKLLVVVTTEHLSGLLIM
mmetsp:Transcript_44065/g.81891  ORF Transcript_44065/g.81891 Transcript_44065/m.81891 type:complete len:92 (+) Transcript_44065:1292-1567(+)